jgi:uncharacterized protein DUF3592
LAAAFVVATLQRAWSFYQSHRGETWPISYGRVMSAEVDTQGNAATLKVPYSYRVENESHTGIFKKVFRDSDEAEAWKGALLGKQVAVRYDSSKPSRSRLLESDLQPIVQAFAPAAPVSADELQAMPWWKRSLCQLGLVLAVIGFSVCLVESVSEKMGRPFLHRGAYALLMLGAVALPLVSVWGAYGAGKRTWRAVPEWMKYLGFVVVFYAAFSALLPHHSTRNPRTRETGLDFTYQLAAYFGAIEMLYARLRSDPQHEDYLQRSLGSGVKIG